VADVWREIYRGRVLHVLECDVDLPNGARTTLEIVRHPGAAAIVPFLNDAEILLVRQYRFAAGGYLLEVPAGKLDPGERPDACAARECEEEVGHRPARLEKLGAILTTPGFSDEVIHLYAGFDLTESRTAHEDDEVIAVERVMLADAVRMVESGEITDGKTVSALLLAARRWPAVTRAPAG